MDDKAAFKDAIQKFLVWLDANGTAGHDPYDLWATDFGVRVRRLYYRYGKAAAPLALPLMAADRVFPSLARRGIEKKRYAMSHAHLILGMTDLAAAGIDSEHNIRAASSLGNELKELSIAGYSGDCWGYPFDWENRRGHWPKGTPFITVTPYGFEAYIALYEATGDTNWLNRARSVAEFAKKDLNDTPRRNDGAASSYSPLDKSLVINASAYRAFVLSAAGKIFDDIDAREYAAKLVRFILDSQNDDGSWLYALEEPGDDFIDHFHTCFVLKCLSKIYHSTGSGEVIAAIEKGYEYYANALFYHDGLPKPFSKGGDRSLKYALYDMAEAMNLAAILKDTIDGALDRGVRIGRFVKAEMQLKDGHFATSVDRLGRRNDIAFIRWPQAQLFHAFASLLKALD